MARRHDSLIPLSHQHQHALALAVIIRRRFGIEKGKSSWPGEMAAKVETLYSAELAGHFEVEETVLFPAMQRYLGPLDLVTQLRQEHQGLRDLVVRVREDSSTFAGEAARPRAPGGLLCLQTLDEFSKMLEAHVRKEERQLFREFEKKMPAEEAVKVGREIEARLLKACPKL